MAYAFRRGARFYMGWVDAHGVERKRACAAATLTEARRMAEELERKAERQRLGLEAEARADVLFADAVEEHLAALPPDFASKQTLAGRLRGRVVPHLGKMRCREVTAADVRRMLAANADVSPQTREHLRVAVQAVFTFLRQGRRVDGNPAAELGKVKVPRRKPRYLEVEDIPRLLAAVPEQHRPVFAFCLGTGARKGEAFALEWRHVHEERGYVELEGSHERPSTKGGASRTVPLAEWLVALLRVQRKAAKSRFVFPGPDGERQARWVALHRIMKAALKRAGLVDGYEVRCVTRGQLRACGYRERRQDPGVSLECPRCGQRTLQVEGVPLPITFHSLRSTWATWAYAHTRDIRFVQLVLGHTDARVTERYAAVVDEHLLTLANRVRLGPGRPAGGAEGNAGQLEDTPGQEPRP